MPVVLYSRVVSSEVDAPPPLRGGRCDMPARGSGTGVLVTECAAGRDDRFGEENTGGAREVGKGAVTDAREVLAADDERRRRGDGGPPPSVKASAFAPHAARGDPSDPKSDPNVAPPPCDPDDDMDVRLPCRMEDRLTGLDGLPELEPRDA